MNKKIIEIILTLFLLVPFSPALSWSFNIVDGAGNKITDGGGNVIVDALGGDTPSTDTNKNINIPLYFELFFSEVNYSYEKMDNYTLSIIVGCGSSLVVSG